MNSTKRVLGVVWAAAAFAFCAPNATPAAAQPVEVRTPQSNESVTYPQVEQRPAGSLAELVVDQPARWVVMQPLGWRGLVATGDRTAVVNVPAAGGKSVFVLVIREHAAPQLVVVQPIGPGPDPPDPDPDPDKPDPPQPIPVPDGWNGLTAATVRAAVANDVDRETAATVARNYRTAAAVEPAAADDLQPMIDKARELNVALRDASPGLVAAVEQTIDPRFRALHEAGKLTTTDHCRQAFRAVADGFELYSRGAK